MLIQKAAGRPHFGLVSRPTLVHVNATIYQLKSDWSRPVLLRTSYSVCTAL